MWQPMHKAQRNTGPQGPVPESCPVPYITYRTTAVTSTHLCIIIFTCTLHREAPGLIRGGGKMRSPGLEKNAEKCGKNAENARKNAA